MKIIMIPLILIATFAVGAERENTWEIKVTDPTDSQVSDADFFQIIADVTRLYEDALFLLPNPLNITADWEKPYFSAWASFDESTRQHGIHFWGGLARIDSMNEASFAFIVCHELGHILGGEPYSTAADTWASAEGQADAFAAGECLPRYLQTQAFQEPNEELPAALETECADTYSHEAHKKVCRQMLAASMGFYGMLQYLGADELAPEYDLIDPPAVAKSRTSGYPHADCRVAIVQQAAFGWQLSHPVAALQLPCWFVEPDPDLD